MTSTSFSLDYKTGNLVEEESVSQLVTMAVVAACNECIMIIMQCAMIQEIKCNIASLLFAHFPFVRIHGISDCIHNCVSTYVLLRVSTCSVFLTVTTLSLLEASPVLN